MWYLACGLLAMCLLLVYACCVMSARADDLEERLTNRKERHQ